MAKKFAGFTEDQALVLLNKVGYTGQSLQADEVDAFLASSPAAQAKLGQYAAAAQKRFDMLTTPTTGFADGGMVDPNALVQPVPQPNSIPVFNTPTVGLNILNQPTKGYAEGGTVALDTARQAVATAQDTFANLQAAYANIDPLNTTAQAAAKAAIDAQQIKVTQAQAGLNTAQNNYVTANMPSPGELQAKALSDP
jgi:hypothetical protein